MITPTMMAARSLFLSLLLLTIAASASTFETETDDAFVPDRQWSPLPLTLLAPPKPETSEADGISPPMLRGGGLNFPPIPPIHPRHTGSVHYSSIMNSDGTTTYRRDINAPCDHGMLLFNIGPARDDMPYRYELYGDAYLWSDNGGLCLLYPSYTGYQLSEHGPFWKLGYDPMTVNFGDLGPHFERMHRISSRIIVPADGSARKNSHAIDPHKAGDYIIMAHHDFYDTQYYKELKQFVNGWETDAETETSIQ